MTLKVIHILHHSDSPYYPSESWKFNLFKRDWHAQTARQIWKFTKKYQLECWRPERRLRKIMSEERDGIVYKAFPSTRFRFQREYSLSMLRELKKECKKGNVLIHLHALQNDLHYLILYFFRNVPIVASNLGESLYSYSWFSRLFYFPLSLVERQILYGLDKIFVGSRWVANFLFNRGLDICLCPPVGVDFEKLQQVHSLSKQQARAKLNLPLSKKIMLHVGRFDSRKGLDVILETYKLLKSSCDVELIVIGGQKSDVLYKRLVNSGVIIRERIPHAQLLPYYSAADVYLFPKFYYGPFDSMRRFAGIGTSPLESLAYGTPILGTNLIHFLGDKEELKKIGKIPKNPRHVIRDVTEMLENPSHYKECSEISQKYYDWKIISRKIVDVYEELFEKYYGE